MDSSRRAGAPPPLFQEVARAPSLTDKVVAGMVRTILSDEVRPGDRLPSERELGEQFGVSRTVIREAVRSLAAKGLIDVRAGSGLRVSAVDGTAATESLTLYLRSSRSLDYGRVHEIRSVLEVHMAGVAAERADDSAVDRMRQTCVSMEEALDHSTEAAALADLEFHRAIAAGTGNELYLVLLDALGDALVDVRRATLADGTGSDAVRAHRQILDAIRDRDPANARAAMQSHLDAVLHLWQTQLGAKPPVRAKP